MRLISKKTTRRVVQLLAVSFVVLLVLHAVCLIPIPTLRRSRIIYSNQIRSDIKLALNRALSLTDEEVCLSVYALTDPSFIKRLNARSNEVITEIILDRKQAKGAQKKLSEHIQVRRVPQSGLMHQKLFVFDDVVFIGSANLTTTSLRMHDNLMIGLYDSKLAHHIRLGLKEPYIEQGLEFYTLPSQRALERILEIIESAQKSIVVAQFTFTHKEIQEALVRAHKRGVKVEVCLDKISSIGASRYVKQALCEAKIKVVTNSGRQLMHHKLAWVDEEVLMLGSANWTKSAFEKNQDDVLLLFDLTKSEKKQIKKLIRNLLWESKEAT